MGNQVPGTKQIKYKTKDGIPISYIFYDLKGRNRFPTQPSNQAKVNAMFQMVISQIDAPIDQINQIKGFNNKYKYRFTIMHKRKIQEQNTRSSLTLANSVSLNSGLFILDNPTNVEAENKSQQRKIKLQQKLKQIQNSKSAIKMPISSLQKLIFQQKAHYQFMQIDGINRIINILQRQTKTNNQGYKTSFSNQIDTLRFIKSYSSHHPKQFYCNIQNKEDYGNIIMDCFHPICTPVTAYALSLLQDYIWKSEQSKSIFTILKQYAKKQNYPTFLTVFTETLESSNNIVMVFHIIKFVNQILASTVEESDRAILRGQLNQARYSFIIQTIKLRLQQYFYKLQPCTFINVSQQIFKYASKGKKQYQNSLQNPQTNLARNTLSMKDLEQQLVMNFFEMIGKDPETEIKQSQQNQQQFMTVYLSQSANKQFNKMILDLVTQIKSYYKLETYIMSTFNQQEVAGDEQKQKMFVENKLDDLKQEEYLKYIRANCIKNDCTAELLSILKNLQYFQKNQLKKLGSVILEQMGVNKKGSPDQIDALKKNIKQKQDLIKKLLKQNIDLKSQVAAKAKINALDTTIQKNNNLPPPPQLSQNNFMINANQNINSILPPPPSIGLSSNSLLPPPPSLGTTILPPPPSLSFDNLLPPPPSLGSTLLPPPSLGSTILPPPPSLGSTILPPPPSLGSTILPPPPSLGSTILPPPPSLGSTILPPPPSFGSTILPPPPSLGSTSLPPPPSLSSGFLPPPPGLNNLALPTFPGIPGLPNLNPISTQKVKQKKKPNIPLKACNYAVLPYEKIKGTIWQQVNDQKVSIDFMQIQKLFAKKVEEPKELKTQSLIKLPSQQKKQPVKLISSERWRNVQIVLTKLKIPKGEISMNILQCTGKYCNPMTLQSIKNILPTQQQQQIIKMYAGDPNQLGKPEAFYRQLISVPQYANRIKALIFSSHKDDTYFETQQKIQQLTDAFISLKNNYRLHYILQISLAVGNYLNGTSLKGGAWGFKLESIQRLQQVKSADSKMNAAYFMIKQVWKKYQYPLFGKEELDMYSYLTKMPISQVSNDIGQLRKILISIKKAQKSQKANKEANDCIGKFCEQMRTELEIKIQQFQTMFKKLQTAYEQCSAFYCQDSKRQQSDEFGKKVFKCIHFIFESQRVFKVVQDKLKKQQDRKAIKSQIMFSPKQQKPVEKPKSTIISNIGLPPPPPPKIIQPVEPSKQQKLKQYQKAQQKAHQDMLKKRQTKVIAYRNSKLPKPPSGMKNDFQDISFLKGIK